MKSLPITLLIAITTIACNKKSENGTACYVHYDDKDSVKMSITINDKSVNGDLIYNLFEKDRNEGKFTGILSGDTIIAQYEFQAEGMMSTREAKFIKKGKVIVDIDFTGYELHQTECDN